MSYFEWIIGFLSQFHKSHKFWSTFLQHKTIFLVHNSAEGSYNCDCHDGYQREKTNQKNCIDIDECALGLHNCGVNTECLNRPNYFQCPCKVGYEMIRNRCTGSGSIYGVTVLFVNDTSIKT